MKRILILFTLTFLFISFSFSEENRKNILIDALNKEEQQILRLFFEDLLFRHQAVYTLFGTKPMTDIPLRYCEGSAYSFKTNPEAWRIQNEKMPKEKYLWKDYIVEGWDLWKKVKDRFPEFKKFTLREINYTTPNGEKLSALVLVNIIEMAYCLQKNYSFFKQVVGFDFDPLEIALEINQKDSKFLKIIPKDSRAMGILYGFDPKNALLYEWKYKRSGKQPHYISAFFKHLEGTPSDLETAKMWSNYLYFPPCAKNFSLPLYTIFYNCPTSSVLKKYEKQRKRIKKIYAEGDFLEITLQRLIE